MIHHFVIHICDWVNLSKDEMVGRGQGRMAAGRSEGGRVRETEREIEGGKKRHRWIEMDE